MDSKFNSDVMSALEIANSGANLVSDRKVDLSQNLGRFGRHAVGHIRQLRWCGPVCHSSMGLLRCGDIGSHHFSGAMMNDCTLWSDQPLFQHSRGRHNALSLQKAHQYVPVLLQQIKLLKGPMWRQGGWAIMAQIDGRPTAMTKS